MSFIDEHGLNRLWGKIVKIRDKVEALINDNESSDTSTYSSNKIRTIINQRINDDITTPQTTYSSSKIKQLIDEGGGGGGSEPSKYLKDAEVDGNTLTITKKDNTTVEFTPEYSDFDIPGTMNASKGYKLANNTGLIRFGIDADGNYGYYKDGADSVTPLKTGGGGSYPAMSTFTPCNLTSSSNSVTVTYNTDDSIDIKAKSDLAVLTLVGVLNNLKVIRKIRLTYDIISYTNTSQKLLVALSPAQYPTTNLPKDYASIWTSRNAYRTVKDDGTVGTNKVIEIDTVDSGYYNTMLYIIIGCDGVNAKLKKIEYIP